MHAYLQFFSLFRRLDTIHVIDSDVRISEQLFHPTEWAYSYITGKSSKL